MNTYTTRVTVFEDPCPQPGQKSVRELIDLLLRNNRRREREK